MQHDANRIALRSNYIHIRTSTYSLVFIIWFDKTAFTLLFFCRFVCGPNRGFKTRNSFRIALLIAKWHPKLDVSLHVGTEIFCGCASSGEWDWLHRRNGFQLYFPSLKARIENHTSYRKPHIDSVENRAILIENQLVIYQVYNINNHTHREPRICIENHAQCLKNHNHTLQYRKPHISHYEYSQNPVHS